MRRALKWLARILAALVLLPVLLVVAVLVALNTAPGQSFVAREAGPLSGGLVTLSGLHGGIPAAPQIDRIEVADKQGAWLVIEGAALDWSPLALLSGAAHVDSLSATRVAVARLPVSQQPSTPSGPFALPVRVDADHVHVGRVEIAAPVAGTAAALSLDGSAHLASLDQGDADVTLRDADGAGSYRVHGTLDPATIHAALDADEPAGGLVARFAKLPALGALSVRASLDGRRAAAATTLAVTAGAADVSAHGTLDLNAPAADLVLSAHAPAMAPAPGVSFKALTVDGRVRGTPAAPQGSVTLHLDGLAAGGAAVAALGVELAGDTRTVRAHATAEGVRLPGPKPDLLAAAPLVLTASARLDDPGRPVAFDVAHPLLRLAGTATTAGTLSARAHLDVAELAPLAAIGGVDAQGHAALDIAVAKPADAIEATLDGTLGLAAGPGPSAALLGEARIGATAALAGDDVTVSRLSLDGRAVTLAATGALRGGALEANADLALPDLRAAAPTLSGAATLHAHAAGPLAALAVQATLAGDVATPGVPKGHVEARVDATGLPGAPAGRLAATGTLDGAPLDLAAALARAADGTLSATIDRAEWKSAHAEAKLALAPGATLPTGTAALRVARLDDFRRLTGQALAGSVDASADIGAGDHLAVRATVRARDAGLPGTASVRRLALDARVDDPLGALRVRADLVADGVRAGAIAGSAKASVAGPRDALAIRAQADATGVAGGPARLATQATLDLARRTLAVATLEASARAETVRLLAPARIAFGDTVAVDRLRLGLRQAVLEVAGRVSPTLDLTASLRGVDADLVHVADPSLHADGTLSAEARLTGTPARPAGTAHLAASGLHLRQGPAAGLPPASITANATLAGASARVDARLAAGSSRLAVTGTAPIDPGAALDLRATGGVDLALTDPILTPAGRRARGKITIDAEVAGTLAAPRASGSVRLSGGEFQDYGQGIHVSGMDALVEAAGDRVSVTRFSARAGEGTISASGGVGLAAPQSVDLHVRMQRASPLESDRLSAVLDADLSVRGAVQGRIDAAGSLTIDRAEIQIPDHLPASVAVLDVRIPGQKPPPPPAPGPNIGLDVTLNAPGQIFVRGRGIDAELEGRLHLGGTAASPQASGGFQLRRGSISVAGTTLTFTSGTATFDGSGKLDPVLDLVATSTSGNTTATLEVTGYASAPKIKLSSVPELPQDEVLARLLFGQPASSLGPFQLGEIALALAQLTGAPGSGLDPLGDARKALGLDRLSVGGGSGGSSGGATVEAGRYVARGVYVGAKQGTSGGGTQAQVQIDITKGLKLETDVGTGGGSATGSSGASSSGTSVGLTYQFEY